MKTIGLLGGMSWESTQVYYRLINEAVRDRLGGLHSAKLLLHSFDFAEIEALQERGDWDGLARVLAGAAARLEAAGAEGLVICTNTMHKLAGAVERAVSVPLVHIADATARSVKAAGQDRVGLLGTRFTMEQEFYAGRLRDTHGIEVLVPEPGERQDVHEIIYRELCCGVIREESRARYVEIIAGLARRGAQGVVLGCTEIPLLVRCQDSPLELFDTTRIHALAAVDFALA
jgi:aspartate racemase